MEEVKRKYKGLPHTFPVYTKEEAEEQGIKYKHWREVETGDWGISDDDMVAECLSVRKYYYRNRQGELKKGGTARRFITFPYGATWVNTSNELLFWPRHGLKQRHGKTNYGVTDVTGVYKAQRVVAAYVHMLFNGKIDWGLLGLIYQPKSRIPEASVRRLFKSARVKKMVDKRIMDMLDEMGITQKTPYELLMKAAQLAEDKVDPQSLIKVAENLQTLMGHKNKNVERVQETFRIEGQVKDLLEGHESTKSLTLERDKPVEEADYEVQEDS